MNLLATELTFRFTNYKKLTFNNDDDEIGGVWGELITLKTVNNSNRRKPG
jgi:hypothetical protein